MRIAFVKAVKDRNTHVDTDLKNLTISLKEHDVHLTDRLRGPPAWKSLTIQFGSWIIFMEISHAGSVTQS